MDWVNNKSAQCLHIGNVNITFRPHHIHGIGGRVFIVIDKPYLDKCMHDALSLSADEARRLADSLKIAACQADSLTRQDERRHNAKLSRAHE